MSNTFTYQNRDGEKIRRYLILEEYHFYPTSLFLTFEKNHIFAIFDFQWVKLIICIDEL